VLNKSSFLCCFGLNLHLIIQGKYFLNSRFDICCNRLNSLVFYIFQSNPLNSIDNKTSPKEMDDFEFYCILNVDLLIDSAELTPHNTSIFEQQHKHDF
jgi:hypothetical protein